MKHTLFAGSVCGEGLWPRRGGALWPYVLAGHAQLRVTAAREAAVARALVASVQNGML